jgi:hypothetical protein
LRQTNQSKNRENKYNCKKIYEIGHYYNLIYLSYLRFIHLGKIKIFRA